MHTFWRVHFEDGLFCDFVTVHEAQDYIDRWKKICTRLEKIQLRRHIQRVLVLAVLALALVGCSHPAAQAAGCSCVSYSSISGDHDQPLPLRANHNDLPVADLDIGPHLHPLPVGRRS